MIKPESLKRGDTIGIVAPASPSFERTTLIRSVKLLEKWGYKVKLGKYVNMVHGYFAGIDKERVEDLNAMFRDREVKAIFCLQGGYGSMRLLPYLDYEAIRKNPKIFLGYSDITALHLAILQKTKVVTFHGPSVAGLATEEVLSDYTTRYLLKALTKKMPIGDIEPSPQNPWVWTITPGKSEGQLVGGNLTMVTASLGTQYEIDTKGKILFLEEVEVEPYQFDMMLTQLLHAGKLRDAAGIVVGECIKCVPSEFRPGYYSSLSIEDVLLELLQPLRIPTIYNLPIGHGNNRATLPLGVIGMLDATNGRLIIKESGVS